MASDGSQPVPWAGKSFPYLMHHPNFHETENYGSQRGHGGSEQQAAARAPTASGSDRTGVWNGAAPRGYGHEPKHAQDAPQEASASRTVSDPSYLLLPGAQRMPLIGLGTYKLESAEAVEYALSVGYRHIDCASEYKNQATVGEGLRAFLAEGKRDELFITSKVWNDSHQPDAVRASCEQSLAELGCGHLDLLLMHWPHAWKPGTEEEDLTITLEDTWQAMEGLVDAGLVRHLGVSNFSLRQVEQLLGSARIKPVCNQVELHPLNAQRKLVGVSLRKGVSSVAYSPLGHSKEDLLTHPVVLEVAAEAGKSTAQVLLKWNVQRGVAVIPKASSREHVADNIEGLFSWRLTWDQKAKLDALDCGKRFVSPSWHTWGDAEEGGALKPSVVLQKQDQ